MLCLLCGCLKCKESGKFNIPNLAKLKELVYILYLTMVILGFLCYTPIMATLPEKMVVTMKERVFFIAMPKQQVFDPASFPPDLSRVADVMVPLNGEDGAIRIAVWAAPPLYPSEVLPPMWLLCFPGATYRGLAYYDRQVAGATQWTWSMVRFLAQQGIGSLIVDTIGTGESCGVLSGEQITRQVAVNAYDHLVKELRDRLTSGTLVEGLAAVDSQRLWLAGVGHSLGGFLLVQTQSQWESFDALAVLGWGYHPANPLPDTGVESEALVHGWMQRAHNGFVSDLRLLLHPFLYSPDVPEELREADEADATVMPLGLLMSVMQQEGWREQASRISCPVYLGFAQTDVVNNPRIEPAAYSAATSITLFIQEGAAHCANFAQSRFTLWSDLAGWCRLRAVQDKGSGAFPFVITSSRNIRQGSFD